MGSFKDRGGKTALSHTGGAMVDFLPLEAIILSVASTTGTSRLENSESGLCPLDMNGSTGIQPTEIAFRP